MPGIVAFVSSSVSVTPSNSIETGLNAVNLTNSSSLMLKDWWNTSKTSNKINSQHNQRKTMTPDPLLQFTDPYDSLPRESKVRLQAWSSPEVHATLSAICPRQGTIQTVINLLLEGLIADCKNYGITSYTHADEFKRLVLRRASTITAERGIGSGSPAPVTNNGSGPETSVGNVTGGGEAIRPSTQRGKDGSRTDPSGPRSRGTRTRKQTKGNKKA